MLEGSKWTIKRRVDHRLAVKASSNKIIVK